MHAVCLVLRKLVCPRWHGYVMEVFEVWVGGAKAEQSKAECTGRYPASQLWLTTGSTGVAGKLCKACQHMITLAKVFYIDNSVVQFDLT
jgi:hypothetical protein